jgi:hypothetical protein
MTAYFASSGQPPPSFYNGDSKERYQGKSTMTNSDVIRHKKRRQSPIFIVILALIGVALIFIGLTSGAQVASAQVPTVAVATVGVSTVVPTIAVTGTIPPTVAAFTPQPYTPVDPAVRAIALSTVGGLQIGEVELPGSSLFIDFNPIDSTRFARVDEFGMLRFAPLGGGEGVYSFAPYHEGFSTESAETNPLFVRETKWSPNGQFVAFLIDSDDPAANDGVWYWQPGRDIGTDPSYHLLRDCPPGCNMVERRNVREWRSLSIDWSSDNQAILVHLELPQNQRRAIAVVQAVRDPETRQSRIGPNALLYDYGSWAADGERIVVSGKDPDGNVVFGFINSDGILTQLFAASSIGLGWVQDAVHNPLTGQIVMLGAVGGSGGALKLYDSTGVELTDFIGNGAPQKVLWSPDRSAVLVTVGEGLNERLYVAQIDGTITDITDMVGPTRTIAWVPGSLPANARTQSPIVPSGVIEGSTYRAGQQLRVYVDALSIYTTPSLSGTAIGTIGVGEYVLILAGPVDADGITWWRVQTTYYTGWLGGKIDGSTTLGP